MSQQTLVQTPPPRCKEKAPLAITVQGNSTITRTAERAIVTFAVFTEGNDQEAVSKEVTATSKSLQSFFTEISPKTDSGDPKPEAPVTAWNMRSMYTGSYRPRDAQGVDLDRVFTANTAFEVEFRDFNKLGAVVTQLLAKPNVNINNTTWRLTEQTKDSLGSQSRRRAVLDAVTKAKDFADAAGCKEIRPVDITDGYSSVEYASDMPQRGKQFDGADGSQLSFAPEDVQLRANVSIKFYAV